MDKSRVKKSILIVVLAIIFYGLLWISLVGLATLIFNTINHNKTNWFVNANLFIIAATLWAITVGALGYNYYVKTRGLKKNGMLSPSEFKKMELIICQSKTHPLKRDEFWILKKWAARWLISTYRTIIVWFMV